MWAKYRRGRHLSIAVPPEIKSQLIRRKALGQGNMGQQIAEALTRLWGSVPTPPAAVVPNPAATAVNDQISSGRYAGMRQQHIPPKVPPWNM
jgi:hypothetical protein